MAELNADDFRASTLDYNQRVSVRYTMDMARHEYELSVFNKLHAGDRDNLEKRKKMMQEFKIKREDLDN